MARQTVKNLKEVKDLSNSILSNVDLLDSEFSNAADAVISMAAELEKSAKYSAENLENAKQVANMTKRSLDAAAKGGILARARLGINKFILSDLGKRIGLQKNLTEDQQIKLMLINDEIEAQIKSNNIASNLNSKLKEGLGSVKGKIAAALSLSAVFATLVSIATSFAAAIDEVGKSFGMLASDQTFFNSLFDSSQSAMRLGGGLSDVVEITDVLTTNFGMSLDKAAEFSDEIFNNAKALGLSNQEAANLFGALTEVVGLSAEQATNFQLATFNLARQSGVAPTAVFKDIVQSSEAVAGFTDASGDNIARAAIQAQKLGVSLNTSAKIAEGLLDFQSSIKNELDASVLIGRQLNFQRARELSLNNDIEGAISEVVSQLGSEEELNSMNFLQRKKLAEAIGVSTEELAKFVGKQQEANTLAGQLADQKTFEELAGEDAISNLTSIIGLFKQIGAELAQQIGGPLEEFLGTVLEQLKTMADEGGLFDRISSIASTVGSVFSFMADNLKLIVVTATALATALTVAAIAATVASGGATLLTLGIAGGIGGLGAMLAFHDLEPGKMVEAGSPDTPVNITQGEVIMHKSDIPTQGDVTVHTDNSDVVEAIEKMQLSVKVSRSDLEFILNSGI